MNFKEQLIKVDNEYKEVSQKINDMNRDLYKLKNKKSELETQLFAIKTALKHEGEY